MNSKMTVRRIGWVLQGIAIVCAAVFFPVSSSLKGAAPDILTVISVQPDYFARINHFGLYDQAYKYSPDNNIPLFYRESSLFPHINKQPFLLSGGKVGKVLYQVFDSPKRAVMEMTVSALYSGLDLMDMAEPVRASMDYLKKKTRFTFGSCGKVQLRSQVKAESCLGDAAKIELRSDYSMEVVQVHVEWRL